MKILINLLKFIFITILTISMITIGTITIAGSTILSKNYVLQKLEEINFYEEIYITVKSNFENYIYQSGLDEEVLADICTQEKIKQDINIILSNIYEGTNQKIDTSEIETKLNENIEKTGIKTKQNQQAIKQFVSHICEEYANTLVHTKYEKQINNIYQKVINILNKIYNTALIVLAIDIIILIVINYKKISNNFRHIGIAILATSIFELTAYSIINTRVNIAGIKIFNDAFSKGIVTITQDILNQIASLSIGGILVAIILIGIASGISINKTKEKQKNT